MYLLSALAAGLVRRFHIDRLNKLSEGIGGNSVRVLLLFTS